MLRNLTILSVGKDVVHREHLPTDNRNINKDKYLRK